ncbi:MAG TPA: hypothetical protein VGA22_04790 [Gemmatimonadales bacterium]|jgi:hypothetical protein
MQPHPSMPHSNPDSHAVERSGIERRQLIRRGEFERRTPEDRRGVERRDLAARRTAGRRAAWERRGDERREFEDRRSGRDRRVMV